VSEETPSSGEIWRLLTKIDKRLDEMSQQAAEREKLLVRADVFAAVQQADALQMRGLEAEQHSIGKRLDAEAAALTKRLDAETAALSVRMNRAEDQRRQDRALLLGSLAFPLLVMLLGALFLSGRL
jgi:hypothetical protein